ncbi:MAG: DUF1501 domain-containing protein [Proteobacteria bacterium]|nr:DUF1501 domain-containing protein [Pseudomonadota bacterium]HQR03401.1 DUF1501 domain-containing protein [Rhodocyclaceae bacterium]
MDRRDFLLGLGWTVLGACAPGLAIAAGTPGASPRTPYDRLLILIELKGGNDGLNTLVPYADPAYYALRPRIGIKREDTQPLNTSVGLHGALSPLMPIWDQGQLAVIQGVGYPSPNLSHFRSIEIWDTASASDEFLQEGWLARVFTRYPAPAGFVADGVVMGSPDMGPLQGGSQRTLALGDENQFLNQSRLARGGQVSTNPALEHVLAVEGEISDAARRLLADADARSPLRTEFPPHAFGQLVKNACQLTAGSNHIAALRLTLSGFDTHQNQPGQQANLLKQLAEGLVALKAGLQEVGAWDRSLVLSYSEFGRRAKENQSSGTDHGTASVQFAMGGRVIGGLHGQMPPLDRLDTNGNLVHTVDFRSVYAEVLNGWWGISPKEFMGQSGSPVGFLQAA